EGLLPFPYARNEFVASEVMAGLAVLGDFALDHVLRRDTGVVGARHPQRVEALHPARPYDHVLERHVERVSQVQLPGDVGRRDDDRKRVARAARISLEITAVDPELKPSLFRGFGVECFTQFQCGTAVCLDSDEVAEHRGPLEKSYLSGGE